MGIPLNLSECCKTCGAGIIDENTMRMPRITAPYPCPECEQRMLERARKLGREMAERQEQALLRIINAEPSNEIIVSEQAMRSLKSADSIRTEE